MANWVLGLTGGIGAGKTAVSDALAEKGICIVDADIIAREVVAPSTFGLNTIVDKFGKDILQDDGSLNRAKLRHIIFTNDDHKSWLNDLLHPIIRQATLTQLAQAKSTYVVLAAPLLFENKLEQLCNHTLLVDVSEETQITRTSQRDNVENEHVKRIIASQMSRHEKRQKADTILDNNGSLEKMYDNLNTLHQELIIKAQLT
ncbi:dephospho-CoA kinase [Pseudoalteromonas aurantia]|uniref:Dephospho-CoA kinase n=1 Tax=Pseudoalteromonas aurantia 208 TaxID=1314867 RepID=A0ABR9EF52_9GAMM|nr:dephospho-CoA kinase [Pseudoalteromonas aurantia]MBE0369377.1 dephospho-CoA kinase [Pseudoalteromonas aurantia 208]